MDRTRWFSACPKGRIHFAGYQAVMQQNCDLTPETRRAPSGAYAKSPDHHARLRRPPHRLAGIHAEGLVKLRHFRLLLHGKEENSQKKRLARGDLHETFSTRLVVAVRLLFERARNLPSHVFGNSIPDGYGTAGGGASGLGVAIALAAAVISSRISCTFLGFAPVPPKTRRFALGDKRKCL